MTTIRFQENVLLRQFTTWKIGGPADFFYDAQTVDALVAAVVKARQMGLAVTILGGGSNVLISDAGIRGAVIKNSTGAIRIRGMKGKIEHGTARGSVFVEADSGVVCNKLVRFTIEEGLGGLEAHLGLPGTVGGAVFMNSKWTHPPSSVGDVVVQATILTPSNEIKVVERSYFRFAYDASSIQKTGDVVLRVVFALTPQERGALWKIAEQSVAYRRESQPQGVKTSGCTFRNLTKAQAIAAGTPNHTMSAGFLIERAGLKGVSVGDAQISPIHANFIINKGRATARDVVELIERARSAVKAQFGVVLEEEIVRLGEF